MEGLKRKEVKMILIDKIACFNPLINVHPLEKIVFSVLVMVLGLASNSSLVHLTLIFVIFLLLIVKVKIKLLYYARVMLVPVTFLLIAMTTIILTFEDSREPFLFAVPVFSRYIGITPKGLSFFFRHFLKSMSILSGLYFLVLTTYMSSILAQLKRAKIPPFLIELAALVYRFIFVLLSQADSIQISQTIRLGHSGTKRRLKSMGMLLSSLLVKILKNVDNVNRSLVSRCYRGEIAVLEKAYPVSGKNYFFILLFGIVLTALGLIPAGIFYG